jgi:CBS domain-containing protein/sporulation protein YlmC with PRC-barrel domain
MRLLLSSLQGRRVYEARGDKVARFVDLTIPTGQPSAEVKHAILRTPEGLRRVDVHHLVIGHEGIICQAPCGSWETLDDLQGEVRLIEDVMDKQVIDIENRKVIRVNDVELECSPGHVIIKAVCVGADSFVRRLGGDRLANMSQSLLKSKDTRIDWQLVQPLGSAATALRLSVPWNKAAALHPADIATLMEDLDTHEQIAMLNNLDAEKAADTLASIEGDDLRSSILQRMDVDKASDIIEEMSPDDAADLLSDLPKGSADAILSEMGQPSSASVRKLMGYDEHTAGGIMTPEYIALPSDLTVDEAITRIRSMAEDVETIYYAYVVDAENRLLGVFSLKDLIVSKPHEKLEKIMTRSVKHVFLDSSDHECVDIMARYDLLALPVLDAENHLMGITTIDDVIDVVIERGGWRRLIKRRRG